ncbi:MAG: hypothetical protein ACK2UK_09370 [Candidatus Promineifilaceae bacterium]|jgi:hypothetical protein
MLSGNSISDQVTLFSFRWSLPRKLLLGVILAVALVAFEIFNFDTTRYALSSLLGDVNFWGISWAVILAVAFCAIDFAGLSRLFSPEAAGDEPRSTWYLMGAWLLGATMNAMMTWWAVNLTLLNHDLGNEVLSREDLLHYVPVFVAVLVWLTRILFIGAFSIAGAHLFDATAQPHAPASRARAAQAQPAAAAARPTAKAGSLPRRQTVPSGSRPAPVGMQASGRRR